MNLRLFTRLALSASFLLTTCALPPDVEPGDPGAAEQEERWSTADDPSSFPGIYEQRASMLPDRGEASPIPWAGNYWSVAGDSINHRWEGAGSMSPAKKYEKAF